MNLLTFCHISLVAGSSDVMYRSYISSHEALGSVIYFIITRG